MNLDSLLSHMKLDLEIAHYHTRTAYGALRTS